MRTLAPALLALALVACMAPPEAEDLVLADDDEFLGPAELHAVPDGVRPPPSTTDEPEFETPALVRRGSAPRFEPDRGEDPCWSVESRGFPAISVDGRTVVVPQADHLQLSTFPGSLDLKWHDVATGEVTRTDPITAFDDGLTWEAECPRVSREIRKHARTANRALAEQSWRAMEPLPLEPFYPDNSIMEYYRETPPEERPVQVLIQHEEIIVRIVGVRVFERHPLAESVRSMPYRVYADRETGTVAVVTMDCIGDSCTCDPSFTTQVVHWQPETFEAIDRHPCVADDEHSDDGYCEPPDFGFNDDPYPWSLSS
ncbi:hypothetical protein [Paraliomyxa miuraensis]|uniref:hypothetical protein n=1 Tax=Paraliomyxa miuraensis TaxID=376150 RepID=UPI0022586D0F|nr:hypothetical protein [Paraliomyxa miuraensis]MCX4245335.1 hypothetical protein [Paraliomyxa miuraensis]